MKSFHFPPIEAARLLKSFTPISFVDNLREPLSLLSLISLLVFCTSVWKYICKRPKGQFLNDDDLREPPLLFYYIPYVGSAISFAINPRGFYNRVVRIVGHPQAYALKILGHRIYVVTGTSNVRAIRKHKETITSMVHQVFALRSIFGASPKILESFIKDNSGIHAIPEPGTNVPNHQRIDHFTHVGFIKSFSGEGLSSLYERWSRSFSNRLSALNIDEQWSEFSDITEYWMLPLTSAMTEALAGPLLECVNPNFSQDLLQFFNFIQPLFKRVPLWWNPQAYALRESLIRDVEQWQNIARLRFTEKDVDTNGDFDPWWGSSLFRERQSFHSRLGNWDARGIATSDLAVLWGANINVHTAAIWTIIEVFKDPSLLIRVRQELEKAKFQGSTSCKDMEILDSLPLLQSIYSEVLRLRVEGQHVLYSNKDFRLQDWIFPKHRLVLVPTSAAHLDKEFWNTKNDAHPLDTFWSDRFLVYGGDTTSGPRRNCSAGEYADINASSKIKDTIRFKNNGLADGFIPYGIGERTCPGRAFSRQEILAFCGVIVYNFDIELLTAQKHFGSSMKFLGVGTESPAEKIPFRVRVRQVT